MVTLVLSENFLPVRGGTVTWLIETYRRYEPGEVIVAAGEQGDTTRIDQSLPFKVERISMSMADWDPTVPVSLWRYLRILRRVLRIVRSRRAGQIHCIKVLPEGLVAWCVRRLLGIPYLVYAHGEEILIGRGSRKLCRLIPRIYKAADAVLANSHQTRALLESIGVDAKKINVIHPGVDATAFRSEDGAGLAVRQRHQLGESPVLLTVGRLQRRKGQDMVIRALPRILERFPNARYVIAGSGEESDYLRRLVEELGLGDKVIFVGELSNEEIHAYFAACDVFIMPNRQIGTDVEGFGIVFLEAGAAGKPVIGGLSGGTGEAIQDGLTGLRVDGESVEEIAAAVIGLLADPKRARTMGLRGRQWVRSNFSWDSIARRTRNVAATVDEMG